MRPYKSWRRRPTPAARAWATTPSSPSPWWRCPPRRRSSGRPTPRRSRSPSGATPSASRCSALWLVARRDERAGWRARSARDRRLSRLSGVFLAAHFATWIPSLSFTTVASSVALVATQPVWAALIARQRGEHIHRQTWIGIGLALAGALVLTGVDLSISAERCSATGSRCSAGCWRRPTSRWAARCGSACRPCRTRWPATPSPRSCSSWSASWARRTLRGLRRGHVARDRGHGDRRAAPRPHAGQRRAPEHQPHRGVGGDPLRDRRRHADRPDRLRRDATGGGVARRGAHRDRSGRRAALGPGCRGDLVDPGGLLT